MSSVPAEPDRWAALRRLTAARVALGRAGGSLPTRALIDFAFDHAEAKDAVRAELDCDRLQSELTDIGLPVLRVASRVANRTEYLLRPAAGGQLDDRSRELLVLFAAGHTRGADVAIIIADGLSATAAQLHGPAVARALVGRLVGDGLSLAPLVLAKYARVALEDEVGQLLGARLAVILLGERPGLGTADSLGAYLVFNPRPGNTNAMRNCVSNIRLASLFPAAAAEVLHYLIGESLRRQISGVELKDERALQTHTSAIDHQNRTTP